MKNPRKIDLIVVHCSATRINQDFPIEALEACHKARGLHSIGYHYYITKDGVVYPCRPETEEGAHARHYNARKHPTPMAIQLHPQYLLGIQSILRNWTFLIFKQV